MVGWWPRCSGSWTTTRASSSLTAGSFPFGFLRLLTRRKQIKRIRLISTNVLPEFQRWGLGVVILARLVPIALAWGIEEAEFSWVLESNHLSYKSLQRGGAKLTKTYRVYDYPACGESRSTKYPSTQE